MIRKSLLLLVVAFVAGLTARAQTQVPDSNGDTKSFSFFFDSDGGYLGIQTDEVTKDNFAKYGLREVRGVAIEKVVEGSPAEKAGLQNGDVIVRLNNEDVTSVRKLTRLLGDVAPDHQARITILRNGSERDLTATLGKRPTPKFDAGSFSMNAPRIGRVPVPQTGDLPSLQRLPRIEDLPSGSPSQGFVWRSSSGRRIGVGVTALTPQLSEYFGVAGGVMINEVRSDSPAAKAGLRAGDIIIEADGKDVKNDVDLIRAIAEKKEGDVTLTIVRERNRQVLIVTPEKAEGAINNFFEMPDAPQSPMAPQQFRMSVPMAPVPMTGFGFPGRVL